MPPSYDPRPAEELYQLIRNRGQCGQASQATWLASLDFLGSAHSGAAALTENEGADPPFPEGVLFLISLEQRLHRKGTEIGLNVFLLQFSQRSIEFRVPTYGTSVNIKDNLA